MRDNTIKNKEDNTLLYYLLLAYTIIFYSQLGGRIPALEAFRIELVIGGLILCLILFKVITGSIKLLNYSLNYAALLFLAACLLTIPFSWYKSYSIDIFIRLLKFFAIYVMILFGVRTEKQLKGFIWVYILCIAFIFCESFFYAIQGLHIRYNSGAMRLFGPPGLYGHPNSLGGVTAASLPFFYFMIRSKKSLTIKIFLIALILIALRVVMYTNSRTAFVGVISFFVLVWLFSRKKILSAIIISIVCLSIWQFTPDEAKERLFSLKEAPSYIQGEIEGGDAMSNRMELIKIAIDIFREYPLTGVGIGNFIGYAGTHYNMWLVTHNLYTQILSETGIIGAIAFILLIIYIFRNLRESERTIKTNNISNTFLINMTVATYAFLILRLFIGLFGDDLYENYWWISGGLSVVILKLVRETSENLQLSKNIC